MVPARRARHEPTTASPRASCATGSRDPGRSSRSRPSSRPRSRRRPRRRPPRPRLPDLDRTDLPLVTIDPPRRDGPRPGAAHRARRRRLRRPLRDRRRRRVRHPGRPGRRGGAPARRDALRRRLQGAAAPEGDLRGRRLAAARPGPAGAAVDDPGRRDRRGHRRRRSSGRGSAPRPSSTTTARSGRSTTARADESLLLLKEVGELRLAREAARGGVSLPLPEQEVDVEGDRVAPRVPRAAARRAVERPDLAAHRLRRRLADGLRPGRAAAHPAAAGPARRAAAAPHRPRARHRVAGRACSTPTSSARSTRPARRTPRWSSPAPGCCAAAGTSASTARCPAEPQHAALASEYAHVTAPLRRLGDRYAGEICVALCAGRRRARLGARPAARAARARCSESAQRSHRYERAVLDLVEAGVLRDRVGETFDGVVVDVDDKDDKRGTVTVQDPAVEARVTRASLPLGDEVTATLSEADLGSRTVVASPCLPDRSSDSAIRPRAALGSAYKRGVDTSARPTRHWDVAPLLLTGVVLGLLGHLGGVRDRLGARSAWPDSCWCSSASPVGPAVPAGSRTVPDRRPGV